MASLCRLENSLFPYRGADLPEQEIRQNITIDFSAGVINTFSIRMVSY